METVLNQTLNLSYFFNLEAFEHAALFEDIRFPWEALTRMNSYFDGFALGNIAGEVSPNAFLVKPELIYIGPGTVVEPGAYIQGPCIIGSNCIVRHGAYIRGSFITGDRCVIGHDTEVKNSIFLNGVHAAHFAYLGDSVLGNRVNLGAGVKCANLKLDHGIVSVRFQKEKISSGLKKLGAIIGDDSQIGCNTVTNPGILMGQEAHCFPCVNVGGFIPSRSIVKADTNISIIPLC